MNSTTQIREQAKGWRFCLTRVTVMGLCGEVDALRFEAEELRQRLASATAKAELLAEAHNELKAQNEQSTKGNRALLGFIHQSHRLGQMIEPGTLREMLSRK